jgi:enoyl-[acyl-carrier-protein] reductase (NADH)
MLSETAAVTRLDATDDVGFQGLADAVAQWDRLDGVLHNIAFATAGAIGSAFLRTSARDVLDGFRVSAYSLRQLAITAAWEAVTDAKLEVTGDNAARTGVVINSAVAGFDTVEPATRSLLATGYHGCHVAAQ